MEITYFLDFYEYTVSSYAVVHFVLVRPLHQKSNMARRSAPSVYISPAYFNPHSNIQQHRAVIDDPNESSFSRFVREQILGPDKRAGNLNILTGVGVFFAGIVLVRTWGDLMIPA